MVRLNRVDMDDGDNMEGGRILTSAPPPYPGISMMIIGPGLAQTEAVLPWRSERSVTGAHDAAPSVTCVARQAGTYWSIGAMPGHARQGMYEKFVVL
jgi:hypothetical protein